MLRSAALALAALALTAALAGCDATSDAANQRAFEDAAFFLPANGLDSTDWRVGPAFDTRYEVTQAPTPNPARAGDAVSLLVTTYSGSGGLALYRRLSDGRLDLIDAQPGQPGAWIYSFGFFGSQVSQTGAPGPYRLIVLDANERVVTYGDVELRP